ncbi:MAG: PspC domain-containing protein [Bacteroidia bacterium]|nr:PspC domain-containing protein [Bacteroidia bacterium]
MQNNPQTNDILNYLNLQEQVNPTAQRMEEINALLSYSRELETQETNRRKRNRNVFLFTGLGLLGGALGALFHSTGGAVVGLMSLIIAVFYSLGALSGNPLGKLQAKMDEMHARLVKPVARSKRRGIFKSKRDKIIAGVASGIAERLGVSPLAVRLMLLALIPISGGAAIFIYLLMALVLSFLPQNDGPETQG